MIKSVSIISALLCAVTALVLAPAAQAKPTLGLADQTAGPLFDSRFKQTKIKKYRIAVSYDQIRQGTKRGAKKYAKDLLARQDAFFEEAKRQRLDVMVSFYRTSMLSPKRAANSLPSVSQFQKDFRLFRKRHPEIKKYSTWNEMNFKGVQPTGKSPKRAGQFYKMLRKECRKSYKGRKCSVLTGDFRPTGSKADAKWLETFKKEIGSGTHRWGLIPYLDTNRNSTKLTKGFLKATKRGSVDVTEVGAFFVFPAGGFPAFKPGNTRDINNKLARQNRSMNYTMSRWANVSSRIKTMYIYSWQRPATSPPNAFDSALINADGSSRPAFDTFARLAKGFRK